MGKSKKVPIRKGGYVECTGVAYFHNAPFDAEGLVGQVEETYDEDDNRTGDTRKMLRVDTESRGLITVEKAQVKGILKDAIDDE